MGFKPIKYQKKDLTIHKAIKEPDFASRTVLADNSWDYVEMWLKRIKNQRAIFYWQQAKDFFYAAKQLSKTASPLTAYYCFLNAVKTLLIVKGCDFSEEHGVAGNGDRGRKKTSLANEIVVFKRGGILAALSNYLDMPTTAEEPYSLKDLLYNLPYIHRSYNLTFTSQPELFIPIARPIFVIKDKSSEAWFCAEITDKRYQNKSILNRLPSDFERDEGVKNKFVIRKEGRFEWKKNKHSKNANLKKLKSYHQKVRKNIFYIYGHERLWYIKLGTGSNLIDKASVLITYAAMHRLSELARYAPENLSRHFESQHNWLLSEFLTRSPNQFIDEISSEITGQEFMIPGVR